ncbi:kelch repeat-containing protein [Paenibacillus sp. VCA1]|uniref:Kelch repeat-containing protein n=1 Tax=Paenibacillus sp. VCA1 TaxID=3039148 RepID=UPI002870BF2F|nr:kelch repeat-containing protein [Paenibacillus sp. VCA1]MDR9852874.1 kelch repeat-containing protein [Paenibacillus sp. VCA1]
MRKKIVFPLILILMLVMGTNPASADNNQWIIKNDTPNPRVGAAVVSVNDKIYVIGGAVGTTSYADVQEYDPISDTWTTKSSMPTKRGATSAAVVNGKIYVIGGYTGNLQSISGGDYSAAVEEYDPITDTWTSKKPMKTPRTWVSSASYNGKIYTMGGVNASSDMLNVIEEYNPETDTWTTKKNMTNGYHAMSLVSTSNGIYSFGGGGPSTATTNAVKLYHPETDVWEVVATMPYAADGISSSEYNGKIYVVGGTKSSTEKAISNALVFDIKTNTFSPIASLNTARVAHGVAVANGKLYAIGGTAVKPWYGGVNMVEEYSLGDSEQPTDPENPPTEPGNPNPEPIGERAILEIMLQNGVVKEFDLSMNEVQSFINWYEKKSEGQGPVTFAIDKHDNNKGPFKARKDYIIFDKIINFEVNEY